MYLRTRSPSSHMTPVSMTTGNIHKVFPAIKMLPKRLVRGADFKIHYIMVEFPLCRAVTQKVKGEEGRKEENLSSSWFYKAREFVFCIFLSL